jgi:beta-mannosidase
VKEQVEYLRQRKYRPVASMYHYYWSDPCPIMGSGLLDHYRRPYQVYDAMRAVYGRVLVSLERDADPYVIGREKVYGRGSPLVGTVWVTNDHRRSFDDAEVAWDVTALETGEVALGDRLRLLVPADDVVEAARIDWAIPASAAPGPYRVSMSVRSADGELLSQNRTDVTVR